MLLLDTCILVWLDADPARISAAARQAIAASPNAVFASAVSAWEVAIKYRKGKLGLSQPPAQWFPAVLAAHGIRELPLDSQIAIRSADLPPIHADPFDRVIVATAQAYPLSVVTPDPLIHAYPSTQTIW